MNEKKPKGYWTKDKCKKEVLKYNTKKELRESCPSLYNALYNYGWLGELCSHMVDGSIKWTKEKCWEEALKYNTKSELKNENASVYQIIRKNGWADDLFSHMVHDARTLVKYTKWTYEACKKEALKYNTRISFQKNSPISYNSAWKRRWLDEICSHMVSTTKPNGYWTKERCQEEALKYKHKIDFMKGSKSAYTASKRKEWYDEICSHMIPKIPSESNYKRFIYSYEFPKTNSVYVGLTGRKTKRKYFHMNKMESPVYRHMKENHLTEDDFIFTYFGNYTTEDAKIKEQEQEDEYRNAGWSVLNIAKPGSLGGNFLQWTKERCQEEALKFQFKSDFSLMKSGAYQSAQKNGWLDEICSHMKCGIKHNAKLKTIWTYETCKEEALKYNTKTEFKLNNCGAYNKAYSEKWLNEICSHMKRPDQHNLK
jgi:hypothetical protein